MTIPSRPVVVGTWPVSRVLVIVAFVLFLLAALLAGGVITASGLGWLLPAGLACLTLAWLVP
jgi:hypothetical protein